MSEEPSREEIDNYIRNLEAQNTEERAKSANSQLALMNQNQMEENLVRWQLDNEEYFDKLYYAMRGYIRKIHLETKEIEYVPPNTTNDEPFNEFGAQQILKYVRAYINKVVILSNFDEKTILWKMEDFGNKLSLYILTRYREFGMDTSNKRKEYPMIFLSIMDTVHAAFLRALNGGERESLRKMTTVSQNQPLGLPGISFGGKKKSWSLTKPSTWF